jgi:glycosyltransferase involved in cell wall biosynthesis
MAPEFAVCFRGRFADELAAAGVALHDLGPARASRPWTVMRARSRLRRLLFARGFDVVICHQPWAQGLFGGVRKRGPAYVAYIHGPAGTGWPERLARWQRPRLLIGPSRHTVEGYRTAYPGVRAEVLNYPLPPQVTDLPPLDVDERHTVRARLGASVGDVVILQASRIEAWKGPDLTVRALARLREVPGWQFWLAGGVQRRAEQTLFDEIRAMARASGIGSRVHLLGPRSDVATLMRCADVYCQGNRGAEGFSLSFLEASYCGLPIVTTNLGGAAEMIDERTGVLVPPGEDIAGLADALRRLIADPVSRMDMGLRGHAKAVQLCDARQQIGRLAGWLGEIAAVARPAAAGV